MSFIHVDHPDEVIHWFAVYPDAERQRQPVGPCPHDCQHLCTATVGWGPDLKHYELVRCDTDCHGDCRGWMAAPGGYAEHVAIEYTHLSPGGVR
jgi:hypothetical protein